MNLDIHTAVITAVAVIALLAFLSAWNGVRALRGSRRLHYYRIARKQKASGRGMLVLAVLLVGVAFLVGRFAEPVAYRYFPPSPTPTFTATNSPTPTPTPSATIYLTPTITLTPAESYTPTMTTTPFVPTEIVAQFTGVVTPNPKAVFSPLTFSLRVSNYQPVNPQEVFENPLQRIFATYTYDFMSDGVQWTALWYRGSELLKYETDIWAGGTGGYGQYELTLPADQWLPGTYRLIFFVGLEWKVAGEFRVIGEPPTPTPTRSPTATLTPTLSPTPTFSPTSTKVK